MWKSTLTTNDKLYYAHFTTYAMKGAALLLLVPGALAIQFPFEIPSFFKTKTAVLQQDIVEETPTPTTRIAIIGAGAGGSSAAFWISKAKERYGLDVEVDVYEKEAYVGGSTCGH